MDIAVRLTSGRQHPGVRSKRDVFDLPHFPLDASPQLAVNCVQEHDPVRTAYGDYFVVPRFRHNALTYEFLSDSLHVNKWTRERLLPERFSRVHIATLNFAGPRIQIDHLNQERLAIAAKGDPP